MEITELPCWNEIDQWHKAQLWDCNRSRNGQVMHHRWFGKYLIGIVVRYNVTEVEILKEVTV